MASARAAVPLLSGAGHIPAALAGLLGNGWAVIARPPTAAARNGVLLELVSGSLALSIRLFVYKVGQSSRNRPSERRLEITSTYAKNLRRARGFRDAVLGLEPNSGVLVGVDPRRLDHGGPTGNASTFVDEDAIARASSSRILVMPRPAAIFEDGAEHQAYFKPPRLAEYLFNMNAIHAGSYRRPGLFSVNPARARTVPVPRLAPHVVMSAAASAQGARGRRTRAAAIAALESHDVRRVSRLKIDATEFEELRRRMQENGEIGERLVYAREVSALLAAHRPELAKKVQRISLDNVAAGYDILSFEPNGKPKLIEVKSTETSSNTFPMSLNEWRVAERTRDKYWIVRVALVRSRKPTYIDVNDPVAVERARGLSRDPSGWNVAFNLR